MSVLIIKFDYGWWLRPSHDATLMVFLNLDRQQDDQSERLSFPTFTRNSLSICRQHPAMHFLCHSRLALGLALASVALFLAPHGKHEEDTTLSTRVRARWHWLAKNFEDESKTT